MNLRCHIRVLLAAALLAAASLFASPALRAQQFAVKANVLSLAFMTPELGAEIVTGEHTSFAFSVMGNYHPWGRDMRLILLQPEFRYWFNGRPMTREFVGVGAFVTAYDISLSERIYKGNALAFGLTGGYVFNLGKRLNLELSGGTGVLIFRQKQYLRDDRYEQYFTGERSAVNATGYRLFPIKLEVSISYIIR